MIAVTDSSSFTKDPSAVLDFGWDFSAWLDDGETITAATVTVPAGLTKNADGIIASPKTSAAAAGVMVWLSGGTVGERYAVVCHITTSAGRQDDRTIMVTIRER